MQIELETILEKELNKVKELAKFNAGLVDYVGKILENKDYMIIMDPAVDNFNMKKGEDEFFQKTLDIISFLGKFTEEKEVSYYMKNRSYQIIENLGWVRTTRKKVGKIGKREIYLKGILTKEGREVYEGYLELQKQFPTLNLYS
ncbi:MAG: hypothetical protein ABH828_04885 [archaeon]